ncbi:MAG TPA: substrate-binding domain-containing protein [Glaciibacter sp.]|nr:substrate-binding domain-containing protein [Glaciibacter sp.]
MWSPPLTTVDQDFAGMGRRGFELLQSETAGAPRRSFSSERPKLVVRRSAGPVAAERRMADPQKLVVENLT